MKVITRNVAGKVVSQAEVETEPINAARGKLGQIAAPKLLVVIPAFVLHVADESSGHATDLICGSIGSGFGNGQGCRSVRTYTTCEFQDAVHQPCRVGAVY